MTKVCFIGIISIMSTKNDQKKYQAVFFDRDGTLGSAQEVRVPTDVDLLEGIPETFAALKAAGLLVYIVTNQSCIARGLDNGYDFGAEFRSYGADGWYICPHDTQDGCNCRKPQNGLLLQAQRENGLDLTRCIMIGDRRTDVLCGQSVGALGILVRTGRGLAEEADQKDWRADMVFDDFRQAADWIIKEVTENGSN